MTKRILTLTFSFILLTISANAQTDEICGTTVQVQEKRLQEDDEYRIKYEKRLKKIEKILKKAAENRNPNCMNGPLIIPVAIHFDGGIVSASQESCAIDVAVEQIEELNREIAGLDVDANLINNFSSCFGANILGNACMEFCIGTKNHPSGYGLVNGDYAVTFDQVSFSVPSGNNTPVNSDWTDYVNIYVDNLPGGLLGVSNGIGGNFNGDGVLVDNCVFGTGNITCPGTSFSGTNGCFTNFAEGEVLAHELGHFFGLRHIWGDNSGCTGNQDNIADTPNMTSSYSNYSACTNHNTCSDLPVTCGSEDMYMNFMAYTGHSCMYMFTSDQADVMNALAVAEGFTTSTTKCGEPPVAAFDPTGSINVCSTECISFSDQSTNSPTIWTWTFTVSSGNLVLDRNSSDIETPDICIVSGTSGVITVMLTVTNAAGSDNITEDLTVNVNTAVLSYFDSDNDGYGDINNSTLGCGQTSGYVRNSDDCDDTDPAINPMASEICDGLDNNCDGNTDEGLAVNTYYLDFDNDGYGDINNSVDDCMQPSGYVLDNTDCDDTDININPGASEICDGIDNNCDGNMDEGLATDTYYLDSDNDGFGDINNPIDDCMQPSGYVLDNTDCDDGDNAVNPNATELCSDNIDNNCDGNINEGCVLEDCDDEYLVINSVSQSIYRAEVNVISDAVLTNGQTATFKAGTDIDLISSFEVALGATFEASIEACDPVSSANDTSDPVSSFQTNTELLQAVKLKFGKEKNIYLTITDKDSKEVFEKQFDLSEISDIFRDSMKTLGKGFYILKFSNEEQHLLQKIVVLD